MEAYKKTLYNKKFSNDINLGALHSRRAPWTLICTILPTSHLQSFTTWSKLEPMSESVERRSRMLNLVLFRNFFKHLQLVLHRSDYEVVFSLFVVFWLFFCGVSWPFRCLWPFVNLLDFVLHFFLSLTHLTSFVVSRDHHRLTSQKVFTSNYRQLEVVGLVHFGIFGSLPDRRSRQSFLIPRLEKQSKIKE